MEPSDAVSSRRPLKSRSAGWARSLANGLARMGVAPNFISFASVIFAALGAAAFVSIPEANLPAWLGWLAAAVCIQLRLICNLMDGMVAVEGNRKSPTGELWNEVPDRFADAFLLLGAGLACAAPWLGVWTTLGALLTAYLRALGAALTGEQDYGGPMAKPQRMAVLTIASLLCLADPLWQGQGEILRIALWVVLVGLFITCWKRLTRLAKKLE